MNPRILFLHPSDELYGADRVLLETMHSLPPEWEQSVWLPNDLDYSDRLLSTQIRSAGHTVLHGPLPVLRRAYLKPGKLLGVFRWWLQFAAKLRKERPDLLYVNTTALALAVPVARMLRIPTILHLHESLRGKEGSVLWRMVSGASRIVAVSHAITEGAPERVARKISIVYNGFELPPAVPRKPRDRTRLMFASRWSTWKGVDVLLEAWKSVDHDRFELQILGGLPVSGEGIDAAAIARTLPESANVTIVGEVREVRPYIDEADVVVVPSILPDPLPTIAIESAAAGRATIASRVGGLPEIIDEGVSGWLVPASDPAALASAINGLAGVDLDATGSAAERIFAQRFSVLRYREEIRDIIQQNIPGNTQDPVSPR